MRGLFAVALLALAGVLALLSNVGLWVDRTVYDTDGFVTTVDGVFDDEDVQQAVADRFTEELIVSADVQGRLQIQLPEGLKFLSLPLTDAVREFLRNATLRLLERQPFEDVRNQALTKMHSLLIAIIEDESGAITAEGGRLVLDLRPILQAVAEDVTGRDVGEQAPSVEIPEDVLNQLPPEVRARLEAEREGGLLGDVTLSENAGQFVIEDASIAWIYNIARYGNDVVYVITGAAVACFVLAIVVARERRSTLRNAGLVLAVTGIISLALLLPLGQVTRQFAKNDAAATSIIDIVTTGYKQQSLAMVAVGVGVAGVAVLLGDSALAVALRGSVLRKPGAPSLATVVRERVAALRIAGLVGAAGVLIVWPEPTPRVYVTTIGLLGLYLLGLFVLESDAQWARTARERTQRFWEGHVDRRAVEAPSTGRPYRDWVGRHTGLLRLLGIVAAVALLLLWPSMNARFFIVVVALGFVYLAGIDLIGSRTKATGDEPQ